VIRIGTSGFSYKDWEPAFYPEGLPARDRLSFYAREFDTVEVNYSFYQVPSARTLVAMAKKTPQGFVFAIKANRDMTHQREDNAEVFDRYLESLTPWIEEGRLGCVLAQFPTSFHNTAANQDYLRFFRERMGQVPTVIEFRHREWVTDEVLGLLRQLGLGFCCVDQPQFKTLIPPIAVATSDVAYVRFHGRNYQKWWHHKEAWERYDYSYDESELAPWVPKIEHLAEESQQTYVYANNHWEGQAVDTARQLRLLLGLA